MTDKFKKISKEPAYKNKLGKVDLGTETITNADTLASFEIVDSCISNGTIIGNTNSKSINLKTRSNYNLTDTIIIPSVGLKYDDSSDEYIRLGKYVIKDATNEETALNGEYKGLDFSNKLEEVYVCSIEKETDWTIADFYIDVCKQIGLTPKKTEFMNSNIVIEGNPFTNNESRRVVLQNIAQCACSFMDIDLDTDEIDLIWFDEEYSDTIDKKDYSSLEKNHTFGPVNRLVIKDGVIDGENVTREDTESITKNGECEISIIGNYFLNTESLRTQAIDNIFERIKGFTYVDCKITSYTGMPYLKRGNKIKVQDSDGTYFDTYVLTHTFTYDGTFTSIIESPALTKTETAMKNKQDFVSKFRKVERTCDKINGQLTDVIEEVNEQGDKLSNVTQSVSDLNVSVEENKYYYDENGDKQLISDELYNLKQSINGSEFTLKETSGNNIFMNSIGMFDKDYWGQTTAEPFTNTDVQRATGELSCWLLNKGEHTQIVTNLKNGIYTVGFLYRKLKILSTTSVVINDVEYDLYADNDNLKLMYEDELLLYNDEEIYVLNEEEDLNQYYEFFRTVEVKDNTLKITFKSDSDTSCYICNLMGNTGDVLQPYSHNINETTTETVRIGQGIEIESTAMNTKFKANADGTRILNKNTNELISEFTDKGIITNDFHSKGISQVSGLLIVHVNRQTWLTGIENDV